MAPAQSLCPGREWQHVRPESESLSSRSLGPGPSEEARRLLWLLLAGSAWWWPVADSSGPATSSRRCPSYVAAAAGEWSGSTGR